MDHLSIAASFAKRGAETAGWPLPGFMRDDSVPAKNEHTPLPWEAGRTGYGSPYGVYSDDATGSMIAMCQHTYVNRSHDEMVANAAFIALSTKAHYPLVAALASVQNLISEAAMTGFNCNDGNWADCLFASQQQTSRALKLATGATS